MALRLYLVVSGAVFLLVGVFHLFRLIYGWSITVGPYTVPFALSYVGCPVATGYCIWAIWLLRATGGRRLFTA